MPVKNTDSIFLFLLACAGIITVQHDLFFWDTVQLASKHAHFFYENGLRWCLLPEEIDSGHPPLLGYYLAVCWSLFGKTLSVSHWAMFPFVWLNLELVWRLVCRFSGRELALFIFPVFIADPVFLTQHLLCSPDVLVCSGMLLILHGHFAGNCLLRMFGVVLLSASSMRGMMTAAALGVWEILLLAGPAFSVRRALGALFPYLPGALLAAVFLYWHWHTAGWTGYHAGSPWAAAFHRTDLAGVFRNLLISGWRWLDFGRVWVWVILGTILWSHGSRLRELFSNYRELILLLVCLLALLTPSALIYSNLSAHRYFLPVFFSFSLLTMALLAGETALSERRKKILAAILALILASGHFWIYPYGVSNDWDCTLVHRHFHDLRRDATGYLNSIGADFRDTGSEFPVLNSGELAELNGDQRSFSEYEAGRNRWVVVSNVSNEFSQATERSLAENMELVWEKKAGQLWMRIYQIRDSAENR